MIEHTGNTHEELPFPEPDYRSINEALRKRMAAMECDLFYLFVYLASEGALSEALEFLNDHAEDPVPAARYGSFIY